MGPHDDNARHDAKTIDVAASRQELVRLLARGLLQGVARSQVRLPSSASPGLELRRETVLSVPGVDRSETPRRAT